MLYDISGVPEWSKVPCICCCALCWYNLFNHAVQVSTGLVKMYKDEVLHKFPVIQHFLFGSLLTMDTASHPAVPAPPAAVMLDTSHPATWKPRV